MLILVQNDIPGTVLRARREDDRIPVLLIQRSIENRSSSDTQTIHGWTMIVPAGWSMPFFSSLVFTNTRVAGQRERQTQAYESGVSYFPRDYPSTAAYDGYAETRAAEEKMDWERKPPAKRVNFEKLGVVSPWSVDWDSLVGLPRKTSGDDASGGYVSTQREAEAMQEAAEDKSHVSPWLLRGVELPKILDNLRSSLNHSAGLLSEINRLRSKRKLSTLPSSVDASDVFKGALVNVKVTMLLRGSPKDLAVVYALSDEMCRKWKKLMHCQKVKASLDDETSEEIEVRFYAGCNSTEFLKCLSYSWPPLYLRQARLLGGSLLVITP